MDKYSLKVTTRSLEVGWKAELSVEFEPLADATEENFWVRVDAVNENGGATKYVGIVEDYMTYSHAHGIKKGFMIEFTPDHIKASLAPGAKRIGA